MSKKKAIPTNKETDGFVKTVKGTKIEFVFICSTSYGYFRYFVKYILSEGGINNFKFVKDNDSYNGRIAVDKTEVEKATLVLDTYKKTHPDVKEMWSLLQ